MEITPIDAIPPTNQHQHQEGGTSVYVSLFEPKAETRSSSQGESSSNSSGDLYCSLQGSTTLALLSTQPQLQEPSPLSSSLHMPWWSKERAEGGEVVGSNLGSEVVESTTDECFDVLAAPLNDGATVVVEAEEGNESLLSEPAIPSTHTVIHVPTTSHSPQQQLSLKTLLSFDDENKDAENTSGNNHVDGIPSSHCVSDRNTKHESEHYERCAGGAFESFFVGHVHVHGGGQQGADRRISALQSAVSECVQLGMEYMLSGHEFKEVNPTTATTAADSIWSEIAISSPHQCPLPLPLPFHQTVFKDTAAISPVVISPTQPTVSLKTTPTLSYTLSPGGSSDQDGNECDESQGDLYIKTVGSENEKVSLETATTDILSRALSPPILHKQSSAFSSVVLDSQVVQATEGDECEGREFESRQDRNLFPAFHSTSILSALLQMNESSKNENEHSENSENNENSSNSSRSSSVVLSPDMVKDDFFAVPQTDVGGGTTCVAAAAAGVTQSPTLRIMRSSGSGHSSPLVANYFPNSTSGNSTTPTCTTAAPPSLETRKPTSLLHTLSPIAMVGGGLQKLSDALHLVSTATSPMGDGPLPPLVVQHREAGEWEEVLFVSPNQDQVQQEGESESAVNAVGTSPKFSFQESYF